MHNRVHELVRLLEAYVFGQHEQTSHHSHLSRAQAMPRDLG